MLHRHEDPFDIPRINRALNQLGLRLLCFVLPTPDATARYNKQFPDDLLHRDVKSWLQFEKSEPYVRCAASLSKRRTCFVSFPPAHRHFWNQRSPDWRIAQGQGLLDLELTSPVSSKPAGAFARAAARLESDRC